MDRRAGWLVARWTTVFAIVLGVLVMHHVEASWGDGESGHGAAAVTMSATMHADHHAGHHGGPADGADLLHLCLAILSMAVGVVLLWLWLVVSRPRVSPPSTWHGRPLARQRPPPRRGREILHRVCVLRV